MKIWILLGIFVGFGEAKLALATTPSRTAISLFPTDKSSFFDFLK